MNKYALALLLLFTTGSYSQYTKFMNSSGDYVTWINNFGAQNLCPVPNGTSVIASEFVDETGNFMINNQGDNITCEGGQYEYDVDCRYTNQQTQGGQLQVQFENFQSDMTTSELTPLNCTQTNVQNTVFSGYYRQTGILTCEIDGTDIELQSMCQYTNYVCTTTTGCTGTGTCVDGLSDTEQCGSCTLSPSSSGTYLSSPFANNAFSLSGDYEWSPTGFTAEYTVDLQNNIEYDTDYSGPYTGFPNTTNGQFTGTPITSGTTQFPQQGQNIRLCQGYNSEGILQQFMTMGYEDNYDALLSDTDYEGTQCIYSDVTQYRYLDSNTQITKVGNTYTLTLPFNNTTSDSITCYDRDNSQSITRNTTTTGTVITSIPFEPFRCLFNNNTYIFTTIFDGLDIEISSFELGQSAEFNPSTQLVFNTTINSDGTCSGVVSPDPSYQSGSGTLNFIQTPSSDIRQLECFNTQDQLVDTIFLSTDSFEGSRLTQDDISCGVFSADQQILQCGLLTKQPNQLIFSQLPQQYGINCPSKQSVTVYNIQDRDTGDNCQTQCYIDTFTQSTGNYNYVCSHYYDGQYYTFNASSQSRDQVFVLPQCSVPSTGSQTIIVTDRYGNQFTSTTNYDMMTISTDFVQGQNLPSMSYFNVINRFLREFTRQ